MTSRANNGMMLVPVMTESTQMKALFATNWDEEQPVFTNIANLTDTLWTQSHEFEGEYRDSILKRIENIDYLADQYNFGYLTAEEVHEAISESIKNLNGCVNQETIKEAAVKNDTPSNVVLFPIHKVRLTPKMQAYQRYLNFELVR